MHLAAHSNAHRKLAELSSQCDSDLRVQIEFLGTKLNLQRRRLESRQTLFHAGQPMQAIYLVHAGQFKTCVLSEDGREIITGFRMRGDLLGIEAMDNDVYTSDAVALDFCEVWELPRAQIEGMEPHHQDLQKQLIAALTQEVRRNWQWMLRIATLCAEQRVAALLLDLAARHRALGFSGSRLMLRMSRAELGNFLAIKLETVTRALSKMAELGVIAVDRREVELIDADALYALAGGVATRH